MNSPLLFFILTFFAGVMIPFQSSMNAHLGKQINSPYYSALIVFITAAFGLALYILLYRRPIPPIHLFFTAPKWSYLGGILGGGYILIIILAAPKLGIGSVTIMVLLGQVVASMLIDHFGLLGATVHQLDWRRLIGISLIIGGVFLVRKI